MIQNKEQLRLLLFMIIKKKKKSIKNINNYTRGFYC